MTTDIWPTMNKDGSRKNAATTGPSGVLRCRWGRKFTGLHLFYSVTSTGVPPTYGVRSMQPSIRNGRILLITPGEATLNTFGTAGGVQENYLSNISSYSLVDGSLLNTCTGRHHGAGQCLTPNGQAMMNSDTNVAQIFQYWDNQNVLWTTHGSDHHVHSFCDADTGEATPGVPLLALTAGGENAPAFFGMTDSNLNNWYATSASGDSSWAGEVLHCYGSFLVDGDKRWSYTYPNAYGQVPIGSPAGIRLSQKQLTGGTRLNPKFTQNWLCTDSFLSPSGLGAAFCNGALRAICLGDNGNIYFYGYHTYTIYGAYFPDYSKGTFLACISTAGSGDRSIQYIIPTNYDPSGDVFNVDFTSAVAYQIAALGNYVVVFQPEQATSGAFIYVCKGHLFCFNISTRTVVWSKAWTKSYFNTMTSTRQEEWNKNEAVQMVIAGNYVFIAEPYSDSGTLKIRVLQYTLSNGVETITTLTPNDETASTIVIDTSDNDNLPVLRELAAVDGALIALIDYDHFKQALVVIDTAADTKPSYPPVAVITDPPEAVRSNYRLVSATNRPINQLDSGAMVQFTSAGSCDPAGEALTYSWDFENGTGSPATSTVANPYHQFTPEGASPQVTQAPVALTVTNTDNATGTKTKNYLIRNIAPCSQTIITTSADALADPIHPTKNYNGNATYSIANTRTGAAGVGNTIYFKFPGVSTTNLIEAFIRIPIYFDGPIDINLNAPVATTLQLWGVTDASWDATTLTWANAPTRSPAITSLDVRRPSSAIGVVWCEFPVTDYLIGASGTVSVAVNAMAPFTGSLVIAGQATLTLIKGVPAYAAPTVVTQPQGVSIGNTGQTATLTVKGASILGEPKLIYCWSQIGGTANIYFPNNGTNAAKSVKLSFPPDVVDTYVFQCLIYDGLQRVLTNAAQVAVGTTTTGSLTITANPNPTKGTTTTLTANVSTGNSGYTFSWFCSDPAVLFNPSSATSNQTIVTLDQVGSVVLSCRAVSASGVVLNASVTVTVNGTFSALAITLNPGPFGAQSGKVHLNTQYACSLTGTDQFGNISPVVGQWSVSNGTIQGSNPAQNIVVVPGPIVGKAVNITAFDVNNPNSTAVVHYTVAP